MPVVDVLVKTIRVHKAGESEAEWRLTVAGRAAGGGSGDYEEGWERDSVRSNREYPINATWLFRLNQGEKITIAMNGIEVDGPFDPNDQLPGVKLDVDPTTAGNNYGIEAGGGEGAEFHYTVYFDFIVRPS